MPFIMNPVFSFVWLGFILFITVKSYRMKLNDFSENKKHKFPKHSDA